VEPVEFQKIVGALERLRALSWLEMLVLGEFRGWMEKVVAALDLVRSSSSMRCATYAASLTGSAQTSLCLLPARAQPGCSELCLFDPHRAAVPDGQLHRIGRSLHR
jgi:hypothetical protein